MPIVEYECDCGNNFDEIVLSFSNVTDTYKCPKCGKEAQRRRVPSSHGFNAQDLKRARQ